MKAKLGKGHFHQYLQLFILAIRWRIKDQEVKAILASVVTWKPVWATNQFQNRLQSLGLHCTAPCPTPTLWLPAGPAQLLGPAGSCHLLSIHRLFP